MRRFIVNKTIVSPIILFVMIISLITIGFSSWQIQNNPIVRTNVTLKVANVLKKESLSIINSSLLNNNIDFDSEYLDKEGRVVSNSQKENNMSLNIYGELKGYDREFEKIRANLVIDDTLNANGVSYREIFYNLVSKQYIQLPSFSDLDKTCIQRDNIIIGDSSYWVSEVNSNIRAFRINSSFKWGKFFNYSSPSVFFDSNNNNGYKTGNGYSTKEIKQIIDELNALNGATYHLFLSVLMDTAYEIDFNPNGGTFNQVEGSNNATLSNLSLYDEIRLKTSYKENYDFLCWQLDSTDYYNNRIYYVSDFISDNLTKVTLTAKYIDLSSSGTFEFKTDKSNYVNSSIVKLLICTRNGNNEITIDSSTETTKSIGDVHIGSLIKVSYSLYVSSFEYYGLSEPDNYGYRKVISPVVKITAERDLAFSIPIEFTTGDFESVFTFTDFVTKNVVTVTRTSGEASRNYEINKDGFIKIDRKRGVESIVVEGASLNSDGYYKADEITKIIVKSANKVTVNISSSEDTSQSNDSNPNVEIKFYNKYGNKGGQYFINENTYNLTEKKSKSQTNACASDEYFIISKLENATVNDCQSNQEYSVNGHTSISVKYMEDTACVVEGTKITMADGTQKNVEDIVSGDLVQIFNHETGEFEVMPILFNNHSDQKAKMEKVLTIEFANGTKISTVGEEGFFDKTMNKYVYITCDNYADYLGHLFVTVDNGKIYSTELVNCIISMENVRIYSPNTPYFFNRIANNMLTMPGGIEGTFNIFEYDDNLKFDEELMKADIEKYGLYTYDDFAEYMSYEVYCCLPAPYFKVAIGKGILTWDQLVIYINLYANIVQEEID